MNDDFLVKFKIFIKINSFFIFSLEKSCFYVIVYNVRKLFA